MGNTTNQDLTQFQQQSTDGQLYYQKDLINDDNIKDSIKYFPKISRQQKIQLTQQLLNQPQKMRIKVMQNQKYKNQRFDNYQSRNDQQQQNHHQIQLQQNDQYLIQQQQENKYENHQNHQNQFNQQQQFYNIFQNQQQLQIQDQIQCLNGDQQQQNNQQQQQKNNVWTNYLSIQEQLKSQQLGGTKDTNNLQKQQIYLDIKQGDQNSKQKIKLSSQINDQQEQLNNCIQQQEIQNAKQNNQFNENYYSEQIKVQLNTKEMQVRMQFKELNSRIEEEDNEDSLSMTDKKDKHYFYQTDQNQYNQDLHNYQLKNNQTEIVQFKTDNKKYDMLMQKYEKNIQELQDQIVQYEKQQDKFQYNVKYSKILESQNNKINNQNQIFFFDHDQNQKCLDENTSNQNEQISKVIQENKHQNMLQQNNQILNESSLKQKDLIKTVCNKNENIQNLQEINDQNICLTPREQLIQKYSNQNRNPVNYERLKGIIKDSDFKDIELRKSQLYDKNDSHHKKSTKFEHQNDYPQKFVGKISKNTEGKKSAQKENVLV